MFIRDAEGKILLQRRVDPSYPEADGKWEFPGGVVDFGESVEAAAVRECEEETGCKVKTTRFLPTIQTRVWKTTTRELFQVFVICFEAILLKGNPHPLDKKVSDVGWFTKEEMEQLDTLVGIKEFIEFADA